MCAPLLGCFRNGGWGPEQWTPLTNVLFTSPTTAALNCTRPVIMSGISGSTQAVGALGAPPPSGVTLLQRSFCRTHFMPPAPPRGPPSTSPASVVAATGPVASTPQGACHQRLQLRWWPLLDLPPAPPGGPPSTSPALVVAAAGPADSTPQGGPPSTFR
jgi:hypothetical protein